MPVVDAGYVTGMECLPGLRTDQQDRRYITAMRIIGLDLSLTSTGVARIDPENVKLETWTIGTKPEMGSTVIRARSIALRVTDLMKRGDFVVVEDYAYGMGPAKSSTITLAELGGIVKLFVRQITGREALPVTTSQMRKFISGDGKVKKEVIPIHTYKRYMVTFNSHDECVAAVLADIGSHLINKGMFGLTSNKQREVLTGLVKKNQEYLQSIAC